MVGVRMEGMTENGRFPCCNIGAFEAAEPRGAYGSIGRDGAASEVAFFCLTYPSTR